MTTINRFVIKNQEKYWDGNYDWTPNIWDAKLYKEKPALRETFYNKVVIVSVEIKEYPYEIK